MDAQRVCQRAARSLALKEAEAAKCARVLQQAPDMYDKASPAWRCLTEPDRDWFTESGKRTTADKAVAGVQQDLQMARELARRDCARARGDPRARPRPLQPPRQPRRGPRRGRPRWMRFFRWLW